MRWWVGVLITNQKPSWAPAKMAVSNINVGDTHHVHASGKNGNYDGRYASIMKDQCPRRAYPSWMYLPATKLLKPNVQGFHGIFPTQARSVDPAINYTTRVFCGAEFTAAAHNGQGVDDIKNYARCSAASTSKR